MMSFTRQCLRLRRASPALRLGSMDIVEAGEQMLIFERAAAGKRLRCTFNLSDRPASFAPVGNTLIASGEIDGGQMGAYAAIIEEIG